MRRELGTTMSFLPFLRGLIIVLSIFAISAYVLTGSLWRALFQTLICAILIQIGYFLVVVLMVWSSGRQKPAMPKSQIARNESERSHLPTHLVRKANDDPHRQ
jgi:exopolysaccharide production repressor protein